MASNESIIQSYIETYSVKEQERFRQMLLVLLNDSGSLSPLSYYLKLLNKIDEALLRFKSEEALTKLKRDLYIAYLLLLKSKSNDTPYTKEIKKCEQLMDMLGLKNQGLETIRSLEAAQAYPGMPASYCGLQAGLWLGERIIETINTAAPPTIEWMTSINEKRLYWVWGGGLLRTVLSLIPEDFYYQQNAKAVANAPTRFTGYMSWTLYFARFALNAFLVLKETFDPSKEKDKELSAWERFKTQWDLRKFTLLNDSIWGLANMVCFFWFKGSDGDALTIALLAFDLFVAIWDYKEQQTKHFKKMKEYSQQMNALRAQLKDPIIQKDQTQVKAIQFSIKKLEKEMAKAERDWHHNELGLIGAIAYAYSLMLSFALMTLPFVPIPAATLIIVGVIGAVLCFALTVIYNGIKGGLEIRKEYLSAKEAKSDLKDKIEEFKDLVEENPNLDDQSKILLFLEIKQLLAKSDYHEQMITYQIMHLVRSMIIQSLTPVLVFVSSIFLPLGVGIGVLSATLVVAVSSNALIENMCKADKVEFSEFDNEEYEEFCRNPDSWSKLPAPSEGFFSNKRQEPEPDSGGHIPLLGNEP